MEYQLNCIRLDYELFESYQNYSINHKIDKHTINCPIYTFIGTNDPLVSNDEINEWQLYTNECNSNHHKIFNNGNHFYFMENNENKNKLIESIINCCNI